MWLYNIFESKVVKTVAWRLSDSSETLHQLTGRFGDNSEKQYCTSAIEQW